MDGHGLDAHFPAGAQHAQGDFTTVGNEDFFEHEKPFSIPRQAAVED